MLKPELSKLTQALLASTIQLFYRTFYILRLNFPPELLTAAETASFTGAMF